MGLMLKTIKHYSEPYLSKIEDSSWSVPSEAQSKAWVDWPETGLLLRLTNVLQAVLKEEL